MNDRYTAAMVIAGVGDAMGYKCGQWEFCHDGEKIHNELKALGGIEKLSVSKPSFIVSDDTVLLLSTAEALIKESNNENIEKLYAELAFRYKTDFANDMGGRAGGLCTASSCHALRPLQPNGWHIKFNPRGGGCGAAMRAMCIGLRYPNVFDVHCLEKLIKVSIESGRMTHNHPTGYLGSFASALFGALAISEVPLRRWGNILISLLPKVLTYIIKQQRDVEENKKAWNYFGEKWEKYLSSRNLLSGEEEPLFPEQYGIKERDVYYKSLSFSGWGGSSGHDAPMIAYDALLYAQINWIELCHRAMLHSGDNDSTGVIAGFCFGAMYGYHEIPKCNYKNLEYKQRLIKSGEQLFALAMEDNYLSLKTDGREIPINSLFLTHQTLI